MRHSWSTGVFLPLELPKELPAEHFRNAESETLNKEDHQGPGSRPLEGMARALWVKGGKQGSCWRKDTARIEVGTRQGGDPETQTQDGLGAPGRLLRGAGLAMSLDREVNI